MVDGAGNRFGTAKVVEIRSSNRVFEDFVGQRDRVDFYRFDLKKPRSSFKLALKSLGGNADVELVQDRNRDGRLNANEVIASSRALGNKPDSINIAGLPKGTYFIRVFPRVNSTAGNADYRLSFAGGTAAKTSRSYQVVELTNAFRERNGLLPLALNTQLNNAAQNYARQMALGDFLDHTSPAGSTIEGRIRQAGYQPRWWAENIGAGYGTVDEIFQGWINSESHRRNILSPELKEIGVGYYFLSQDTGVQNWSHYWTQSFGTLI